MNGRWRIDDSASGNGKISSIPAVDGGGAPNCPKMIKQWRYIKERSVSIDTSNVEISCKTNHHKIKIGKLNQKYVSKVVSLDG